MIRSLCYNSQNGKQMVNVFVTYASNNIDDTGLNEVIIEKTEDIVMFRFQLLVSRNDKSIIVPNRQSLE
jgi:hypothetical protein